MVQKTFFSCEPRQTSLTTIAIGLSHSFLPVEAQRLPSSARTYPSAQEHNTSFRPSLLTVQNCSQSPLFILQNFGMTIKEMVGEKLYVNTDFTEGLGDRQNKTHSLNGICISICQAPEAPFRNNVSVEHQLVPYRAATSSTQNILAKPKWAQWPWHGELRKAEANCQGKNEQTTNREHNCVNPHTIPPSCPKNLNSSSPSLVL